MNTVNFNQKHLLGENVVRIENGYMVNDRIKEVCFSGQYYKHPILLESEATFTSDGCFNSSSSNRNLLLGTIENLLANGEKPFPEAPRELFEFKGLPIWCFVTDDGELDVNENSIRQVIGTNHSLEYVTTPFSRTVIKLASIACWASAYALTKEELREEGLSNDFNKRYKA